MPSYGRCSGTPRSAVSEPLANGVTAPGLPRFGRCEIEGAVLGPGGRPARTGHPDQEAGEQVPAVVQGRYGVDRAHGSIDPDTTDAIEFHLGPRRLGHGALGPSSSPVVTGHPPDPDAPAIDAWWAPRPVADRYGGPP